MTRRRVPPLLMFTLALLLTARAACANDSTGFQGTTGIELSTSSEIRMLSEDLRIGLDEIRVSYVFRNVSDHPVDTMVVFPLPDLDLSQGLTAAAWAFPREDDDFLGFKLWIDDRAVTPTLERRAFFQGKDVTAEIRAAGALEIVPWKHGATGYGYDDQARALSPAQLEGLRRAGLIREGEDQNTPQWQLGNRYYWRQTFPPGRDVQVRHAYKPFVGSALLGDPTGIDGRRPVGRLLDTARTADGDRYCLDDDTRRALAAAQKREPKSPAPFSAAEIAYILTTARNWRGPIGRFHLTLDKGAPDNIVSLCWNGLKKTGPTTFETVITDFMPDRDISLLIFVRAARPSGR